METWKEAYNDYKKGLKYKEIADKFSVSEGTVKSWAARKWKNYSPENASEKAAEKAADEPEKVAEVANEPEKVAEAAADKKTANRKKGGQKGNKNAVGNKGGAPEGSKNNYKHGLYEKFNINALTEEEYGYLMSEDFLDEKRELEFITKLGNIQLKRLMEKMPAVAWADKGLVINSISKTISRNAAGVVYDESSTTRTVSADELALKFGNAIEHIRKQQLKCIALINKINRENSEENKKSTDEDFQEDVIVIVPDDGLMRRNEE